MSEDGYSRSIDGFSIFGLIVVLLAMIPMLFPIKVKLGCSLTLVLRKSAVLCRLVQPPLKSSIGASSAQHVPPPNERNWHVPLDLTTSPVLAVLLLLATTTINGSVIRTGIVGDGDSKPYDVLILFIALAYIATALDSTGALKSLAFLVSNHSGGSGPRLYFVLYWFFFVFGVIFGNDPIILSGTAFLTYFLRHCGITDPTAWIFMEFIASNIASAVLVSSNPTNVLLAQAFDLNFLTGFTKFTIIPSFVSAIVGYVLLYTLFKSLSVSDARIRSPPRPEANDQYEANESSRLGETKSIRNDTDKKNRQLPKLLFAWIPRANYIPDKLYQPIVNPRSVLVDPHGAFFHGILMITTLLLLVGTAFIKTASVYHVTMPAGILALVRDILWDIRSYNRKRPSSEEHELAAKHDHHSQTDEEGGAKLNHTQGSRENYTVENRDDPSVSIVEPSKLPPICLDDNSVQQKSSPEISLHDPTAVVCPSPEPTHQWNLSTFFQTVARRFPTTSHTIKHLPLPLLPFAMSMFILISSLKHLGWVAVFAHWLASMCTTPARTVYIVGLIGSMILCPFLGTNIGATILMVNVISDPNFKLNEQVMREPKIMQSAIFATALSSNIGAFSLTIPSSLAGLLWHQILRQKHILIRNRDFLFWNFLPIVTLSLVSLSVVLLEIMLIF